MNRIQSKNDKIETYELNKTSLLCFDDKIHILNKGYDGLALCYLRYLQNTVILITTHKSFLSSNKYYVNFPSS